LEDAGTDRKRYPVEDIARVITIPILDVKSVAHVTAMNVVGVIGEMAWKGEMGNGRRSQEKRRREAWRQEESTQISLLRDVVGNPFRPVTLNPAWLLWNDCTIPKLAQGIYEERAFDRLPILADALEEGGCNDADIRQWVAARGLNRIERAACLGLSVRTLHEWEDASATGSLMVARRGRPVMRSERSQRTAVLEVLGSVGPGVGLAVLQGQFAPMPRAELADLLRRYRRVWRRRHRQVPGA
jgi:hypothetical protein